LDSGTGCYIELAQVTSTLQLLGPHVLAYGATGTTAQPEGNADPVACPYGAFRCGDGDRWLAVSVRTEEQWRALCGVMGRPELVRDPGFATAQDRKLREREVNSFFMTWL